VAVERHQPERGGKQRREAKALAALGVALGKPQADIAEECGISPRGLRNWLKQASFQARVSRIRGQVVGQAVGQLVRDMTSATATLRGLLSADDERVRLAAAVKVLELSTRLRESAELEQRLAEVEERVKSQGVL
jgi:hypothetical protein